MGPLHAAGGIEAADEAILVGAVHGRAEDAAAGFARYIDVAARNLDVACLVACAAAEIAGPAHGACGGVDLGGIGILSALMGGPGRGGQGGIGGAAGDIEIARGIEAQGADGGVFPGSPQVDIEAAVDCQGRAVIAADEALAVVIAGDIDIAAGKADCRRLFAAGIAELHIAEQVAAAVQALQIGILPPAMGGAGKGVVGIAGDIDLVIAADGNGQGAIGGAGGCLPGP